MNLMRFIIFFRQFISFLSHLINSKKCYWTVEIDKEDIDNSSIIKTLHRSKYESTTEIFSGLVSTYVFYYAKQNNIYF